MITDDQAAENVAAAERLHAAIAEYSNAYDDAVRVMGSDGAKEIAAHFSGGIHWRRAMRRKGSTFPVRTVVFSDLENSMPARAWLLHGVVEGAARAAGFAGKVKVLYVDATKSWVCVVGGLRVAESKTHTAACKEWPAMIVNHVGKVRNG